LPKINAFTYITYASKELVYLAHDGIVDCGTGIRTLEIKKIVPIQSFYL